MRILVKKNVLQDESQKNVTKQEIGKISNLI